MKKALISLFILGGFFLFFGTGCEEDETEPADITSTEQLDALKKLGFGSDGGLTTLTMGTTGIDANNTQTAEFGGEYTDNVETNEGSDSATSNGTVTDPWGGTMEVVSTYNFDTTANTFSYSIDATFTNFHMYASIDGDEVTVNTGTATATNSTSGYRMNATGETQTSETETLIYNGWMHEDASTTATGMLQHSSGNIAYSGVSSGSVNWNLTISIINDMMTVTGTLNGQTVNITEELDYRTGSSSSGNPGENSTNATETE